MSTARKCESCRRFVSATAATRSVSYCARCQRRRVRVFRKAGARWELRCAREFQRWQPFITVLSDVLDDPKPGAPVDLVDALGIAVTRGLVAFDAIRNRSTGAGPAAWSESADSAAWSQLRGLARGLVQKRDALDARYPGQFTMPEAQ